MNTEKIINPPSGYLRRFIYSCYCCCRTVVSFAFHYTACRHYCYTGQFYFGVAGPCNC